MRCYICNNELSESEIQLDEESKSEPCTTCLKIIMDTAYSNGFSPRGDEEPEYGDDSVTVLEEGLEELV